MGCLKIRARRLEFRLSFQPPNVIFRRHASLDKVMQIKLPDAKYHINPIK